MTFADPEYAGKRKQTREVLFLIEMDLVMPWNGLTKLIEPSTRRMKTVVRLTPDR